MAETVADVIKERIGRDAPASVAATEAATQPEPEPEPEPPSKKARNESAI